MPLVEGGVGWATQNLEGGVLLWLGYGHLVLVQMRTFYFYPSRDVVRVCYHLDQPVWKDHNRHYLTR